MDDYFDAPDGDIILRAQGPPVHDFRVHKLILSLASSVFRDMFGVPQPRSYTQNVDIDVVDVTDPPRALDLVLKLIYPFLPPKVDDLDLLVQGFIIADEYNIEGVRVRLREPLNKLMKEEPLRVYAIASRFGLEEEAEAAASLTTGVYLPGLASSKLPDDLKHVPAPVYHKLIELHEKHRYEIEDIINDVPFEPSCPACKVMKGLVEPWLRTKLMRIICRGESITIAACAEEITNDSCREGCMVKFVTDVVIKLDRKNTVIHLGHPVHRRAVHTYRSRFIRL